MKTFFSTLLVLFSWLALAQPTIPPFNGDILDEAEVLDPQQEQRLLVMIRELREDSNVWLAVYLAKDLQGTSIADLTYRTFENWKLGQKGQNNGMLIVIVPSERKMRIEVGYGWEPVFTDAWTKILQEEELKPFMHEGRYFDGLEVAIKALKTRAAADPMKKVAQEFPLEEYLNYAQKFVVLPLIFYILAFKRRRSLKLPVMMLFLLALFAMALSAGFALLFVLLKLDRDPNLAYSIYFSAVVWLLVPPMIVLISKRSNTPLEVFFGMFVGLFLGLMVGAFVFFSLEIDHLAITTSSLASLFAIVRRGKLSIFSSGDKSYATTNSSSYSSTSGDSTSSDSSSSSSSDSSGGGDSGGGGSDSSW